MTDIVPVLETQILNLVGALFPAQRAKDMPSSAGTDDAGVLDGVILVTIAILRRNQGRGGLPMKVTIQNLPQAGLAGGTQDSGTDYGGKSNIHYVSQPAQAIAFERPAGWRVLRGPRRGEPG